uniref:Migration and invasion enhancer 1 n=2 Tax=Macaca fascicularis TaxID=9541 RepID=A0A7N9IHA9_MACFA
MSGEPGQTSVAPPPEEVEPGSGVRIMVEYCEPCGFEATYLELASAVKEQYPGIEIESRLGGTGAFEIEINGQLVFSKLENGGFPYEKDGSRCPGQKEEDMSEKSVGWILPAFQEIITCAPNILPHPGACSRSLLLRCNCPPPNTASGSCPSHRNCRPHPSGHRPHLLGPPTPGPGPDLVDCAKSSRSKHLHLPQLRLFQDPHLRLVGHRSTRCQWLHQLGSLRIVYFRIFCCRRLMRIPKTTPKTTTSRMPTTAEMMDVRGLGAEPGSGIEG